METLDYNTCKKLKDAGFPQIPQHNFIFPEGKEGDEDSVITIPTLEELIEECGEKDFTLKRTHDNKLGWIWRVFGWTTHGAIEQVVCNGKTPHLALSNLYLKLNKVINP